MLAAFGLFLGRLVRTPWWGMRYLFDGDLVRFPRRLILLCLLLPLFLLLQMLHWLGFLLDELVYRGYRQVPVHRPVFIVGPPRSGTTFLQRTLARDAGFTTLCTWEALLAPSISERYFYSTVAWLLRPIMPLVRKYRPPFLRRLDPIHNLALLEPEEDILLLLPVFSCLQMCIFFPDVAVLWQLACFDRDVVLRQRRAILDFYFRCVQKHIYFHGGDARFMAKNPTFSSMIDSVAGCFPDARFIVCVRDPEKAVPSLLSLLNTSLDLIGLRMSTKFRDKVLELLHYYYSYLPQALARHDSAAPVVNMADLQQRLPQTITVLYRELEQPLTPAFADILDRQAETARGYVSSHCYTPEEFGLDRDELRRRFDDVWPLSFGNTLLSDLTTTAGH